MSIHTPLSSGEPGLKTTQRSGAILYADLVESVRLNRSLGDHAVARWMAFEKDVRGRITPVHGGQIIKSTGDGFLIVFETVTHALAAAFGMLMTLSRETVAPDARFDLRIGVTYGSFVDAGFDIFGQTVDVSQRLSTIALPGEVILSRDARSRLAPGCPAQIDDLGPRKLKHIDELVPAFRAAPPGKPVARRPVFAQRPLTPTIAVADITAHGTCANERMATRIADDLRRSLSRSVGLSISSRIDALLSASAPEQIVPYIVSGTITDASAGQIDILLELASSRTGALIWQTRHRAHRDDLHSLDAPVIAPIAADISRHLIEAECTTARGRPFDALESHTLLVAAVNVMYGLTPAGFACAHGAFETLADTSGRHPTPLAWLSIWHVMNRLQNWEEPSTTSATTARDLATRALQSASTAEQSAHAQTALGLVLAHLAGDPEGALRAFAAALSHAPTDGAAMAANALTLACLGDGAAATKFAHRALSLSPLDPQAFFFHTAVAFAALSNGAPQAAKDAAETATKCNPNFHLAHLAMAIACAELGDTHSACFSALTPGTRACLSALPAANGPMVARWSSALAAMSATAPKEPQSLLF